MFVLLELCILLYSHIDIQICPDQLLSMWTHPWQLIPDFNLTTRVQNIQHLLDGKSDITPDENIPSPLQQEETISSSGNGDDRSVTNPGDGEPMSYEDTQSQGDNETGNAIQVRNVLIAFFNLSPED